MNPLMEGGLDIESVTAKPYCVIGRRTKVGKNSRITKSVIGEDCNIGSDIEITSCRILDNVKIDDGCRLSNTIVCDGVAIESGSVLGDFEVEDLNRSRGMKKEKSEDDGLSISKIPEPAASEGFGSSSDDIEALFEDCTKFEEPRSSCSGVKENGTRRTKEGSEVITAESPKRYMTLEEFMGWNLSENIGRRPEDTDKFKDKNLHRPPKDCSLAELWMMKLKGSLPTNFVLAQGSKLREVQAISDFCQNQSCSRSSRTSTMKVVAAYFLVVLGGNPSPTADDLTSILASVDHLLSGVSGKDITELIASGREKLAFVPSSGGGSISVAATGGGSGATPALAYTFLYSAGFFSMGFFSTLGAITMYGAATHLSNYSLAVLNLSIWLRLGCLASSVCFVVRIR